MLIYALCQTESAFWSMLKYWPLYSVTMGNNSDTETSLVVCGTHSYQIHFLWNTVLGKKISHNSAIEVSSLIESNQTQQHILKKVLKKNKQLPLDVSHRDSAVLPHCMHPQLHSRPTPLHHTSLHSHGVRLDKQLVLVCDNTTDTSLLHIFLVGKQGKWPGDCRLHTLSVCFSAKYWKTTVGEEQEMVLFLFPVLLFWHTSVCEVSAQPIFLCRCSAHDENITVVPSLPLCQKQEEIHLLFNGCY